MGWMNSIPTGRSDLPVNLSVIPVTDRIRADLAKVDGELALSSVMWLVKDGMLLDPIGGRIIWEYPISIASRSTTATSSG
jgi:hypothetical protein